MRRVLFLSLCAVVLAVRNHGPAHTESDEHARSSQDMTQRLWRIAQEHTQKMHKNLDEMRAYRPKPEDHDLNSLKNLRNRYSRHQNPAISLLEKTSYSRPIEQAKPEADEASVMKDLFGFDDSRVNAELSQLKQADPELFIQEDEGHDAEGFSEEAMKALLTQDSAPSPAAVMEEELGNMLELGEGARAAPKPKKVLDWKKWEKFMLNEFEAARMTGDLDAAAHKLPEPAHISTSLQLNMELDEGNTGDFKELLSKSENGVMVDKMCGCEVSLSPVCGGNGETYPSACFAKCAGLEVSHEGPCLDKKDLERVDSFQVISKDQAGHIKAKRDEEMGIQNLMMFGDEDEIQPRHSQASYSTHARQEAGVDYPSLGSADATQVAREAHEDRAKPQDIALPFARPITKRQFDEDLKQLNKVADEFAPVALDNRMSQCECRGEYDPVCGKDFKTYPSSCYASCLGVELRHIGACHDNTAMEITAPSTLEDVRDPICFCSLKEKRVCGVNGKTYINRCFANCEEVNVLQEGPCL